MAVLRMGHCWPAEAVVSAPSRGGICKEQQEYYLPTATSREEKKCQEILYSVSSLRILHD